MRTPTNKSNNKIHVLFSLLLAIYVIFLSGCATVQPTQKANLTYTIAQIQSMLDRVNQVGSDSIASRPYARSVGGSGGSMVYPAAGIPLSNGGAWLSSITNNSANWNTAYGWGNWASNFGSTAGTIAQGNDSRITHGETAYGWGNPSGVYAPVSHTHTESDLNFSDITTANASSSMHGLMPKLNMNTSTYLRGDGTWSEPAGGTGGVSYPAGTGIVIVSGGTSWGTTITDNSTNWNTAYTDRYKWDGGSNGLTVSTARTSLGFTTFGTNLTTMTNPGQVGLIQSNADNTVSSVTYAQAKSAMSISEMSWPSGSGIPIVSGGSSWGTTITDNSINWNTAYTDRLKWDGGSTGLTASTGRTSLGATTIGGNLFTLTNPSINGVFVTNSSNVPSVVSYSGLKSSLAIAEADLVLSDVTTKNSSTSMHGFLPKLDNNTGHFLRGDGSWADPSVTGVDLTTVQSEINDSLNALRTASIKIGTVAPLNSDTISLYTWSVGVGAATDTACFRTFITHGYDYGNFYWDGSDTLVITKVIATVNSGASVGVQIRHSTSAAMSSPTNVLSSALTVTSSTTGNSTTTIANGTIVPGEFVDCITPTLTTRPKKLRVTIIGHKINRAY